MTFAELGGPLCSESEAVGLFRDLCAAFPRQSFDNVKHTSEFWVRKLRQWPYAWAKAAVEQITDNAEYGWPNWPDVCALLNARAQHEERLATAREERALAEKFHGRVNGRTHN